jgi:hypothetical protein
VDGNYVSYSLDLPGAGIWKARPRASYGTKVAFVTCPPAVTLWGISHTSPSLESGSGSMHLSIIRDATRLWHKPHFTNRNIYSVPVPALDSSQRA